MVARSDSDHGVRGILLALSRSRLSFGSVLAGHWRWSSAVARSGETSRRIHTRGVVADWRARVAAAGVQFRAYPNPKYFT